MTTTKIMIILVVEDDAVPEHQQTVDADIKALLVSSRLKENEVARFTYTQYGF